MLRRLLMALVRAYQLAISPLLPPACRFTPTCSAYAHEALGRHGALKGSRLALWRLLRCHPFHPGGYDPVPPLALPGDPGSADPVRAPEPGPSSPLSRGALSSPWNVGS